MMRWRKFRDNDGDTLTVDPADGFVAIRATHWFCRMENTGCVMLPRRQVRALYRHLGKIIESWEK